MAMRVARARVWGMDTAANLRLARRMLAALETGDVAAVGELVHPGHRDHANPGRSGVEGVRAAVQWLKDTFEGLDIVPLDLVAADDRVVARVHFTATYSANGRRIDSEQVHIWRVAEGRLAEHWMVPAHPDVVGP